MQEGGFRPGTSDLGAVRLPPGFPAGESVCQSVSLSDRLGKQAYIEMHKYTTLKCASEPFFAVTTITLFILVIVVDIHNCRAKSAHFL